MVLSVKHTKVDSIPDGTDPNQVQPSDWNAEHTLSGFGGAAQLNVGTAAGTVAAGNDSRFGIPSNPTLTGLAGIGSGLGLVTQTAVNTFTTRTLAAGAGIAISNSAGTAGNPSIAVDQAFSPTWTGTHTFGDGAGAEAINLSGGAGFDRTINFRTAGTLRWGVRATAAAESGGNAGSAFMIDAYNDAGAYLNSPLQIARATGLTTLTSLSVSGATTLNTLNVTGGIQDNGTLLTAKYAQLGASNNFLAVGGNEFGATGIGPANGVDSFALRVSGSFGGGIGFVNGTINQGIWSQGGPELHFGDGTSLGALTSRLVLSDAALAPTSNKGLTLGTATRQWADAWFADGLVTIASNSGSPTVLQLLNNAANPSNFGLEIVHAVNTVGNIGYISFRFNNSASARTTGAYFQAAVNTVTAGAESATLGLYVVRSGALPARFFWGLGQYYGTGADPGDGNFNAKTDIQIGGTSIFDRINVWTQSQTIQYAGATLVIDGVSTSPNFIIQSVAASSRGVTIRTGNSFRWFMGAISSAETGGNAGSTWALLNYDDSGGFIGTIMSANRATSIITFNTGLSAPPGGLQISGVALKPSHLSGWPGSTVDNNIMRFDGTAGNVQAAKATIEDPIVLPTDTAITIPMVSGGNGEIVLIVCNQRGSGTFSGIVHCRPGNPSIDLIGLNGSTTVPGTALQAAVVLDASAVALTGTTGPAGQLTIRCGVAGVLLSIENRTGATRNFNIFHLGSI